MTSSVRGPLGVVVAALGLAGVAHFAPEILAADWPQFRGAHRDGVSAETGLLGTWPDSGPRLAWRHAVGEGFSGMAIAGGRLYTMYAGDHDGKPTEFAAALDPATGQEIWRTAIGEKYDNEFGNGPRATPTVDGDAVYVVGSRGTLAALAAADGALRWKLECNETFGTKVPTFGYSVSPLVDGGKVLLEAGGPEGKAFAAVDAKTGSVLWTSGDGSGEAGYNSPLAIDLGGKRQYVQVFGDKIRSLDGAGKELWSHPWPPGETHATPVLVPPDRLFVSGVEGVGAALLQIRKDKSGLTPKDLWKNPSFRSHFNAAVLHENHLYGFDNTTLKCISVKDGSLAWTKRGLGKGSLVLADGQLLVLADDGRLLLVEASPAAYKEKGAVQALEGRCWTPPALSGGMVFVRNHAEIAAYHVKS